MLPSAPASNDPTSAVSVNKGENVTLYVSTNTAQTYTIDVYRRQLDAVQRLHGANSRRVAGFSVLQGSFAVGNLHGGGYGSEGAGALQEVNRLAPVAAGGELCGGNNHGRWVRMPFCPFSRENQYRCCAVCWSARQSP